MVMSEVSFFMFQFESPLKIMKNALFPLDIFFVPESSGLSISFLGKSFLVNIYTENHGREILYPVTLSNTQVCP